MKALIAGEAHKKGRSFTARDMAKYEDSKAYRNQSVAWLLATRGSIPIEVVDSWSQMQWPMNQFHSFRITAKGMEVASAYNALARICLDRDVAYECLGRHQYADMVVDSRFVLTTEEDNMIPPDAVLKLLEAIYTCPDCGREIAAHCAGRPRPCKNCKAWKCEKGHKGYDGVSGWYSVKTRPAIPMAFGDPKDPEDFRPRSVARAARSGKVIEVNGIAMGCALFRKDLFKKVSKPLFDTTPSYTQDLYFCKKAKKEAGARFAVHTGVRVGHLDVRTGEIV